MHFELQKLLILGVHVSGVSSDTKHATRTHSRRRRCEYKLRWTTSHNLHRGPSWTIPSLHGMVVEHLFHSIVDLNADVRSVSIDRHMAHIIITEKRHTYNIVHSFRNRHGAESFP